MNRLGRDCEAILEAMDAFDGTGVGVLESLPVVETDSKEALGVSCEDGSVEEKFVSMEDLVKGCVVVGATSPVSRVEGLESTRESSVGFIVNKDPVCWRGKGCRGASGGIGNFVTGPK